MSKEIVEAVHVLEREKGIAAERLMAALEDALLSAYKKQPGSARYARVDMERDSGDFVVFELLVPEELEEQLLSEVEIEEPTVDPETGEMREPEEPEIDQELLDQYRDEIDERDVTPDNFGRIAAQTAKQVILQRIREAERDMMFEEYQDRVGELITGIIPLNEEPARFVAKALSPARVREVLVDDELKQATVVVPDDQLSLAIGKEGQNARLAARLTGWRVDIRSETEFAAEEAEMAYEEDETSGRCAAIMSTGKRCPNAALPGSRYCGLPAHQALADQEGDEVAPAETPAAEEEAPVAEEAPV